MDKEYIKKDSIINFFAERLSISKDGHMKEYIERKEALRQIFLEEPRRTLVTSVMS